MIYESTLEVNSETTKWINHIMTNIPTNEEECFSEDSCYCETVKFPNGYEMDIKMCGVQFDKDYKEGSLPWTEAILFNDKGYEVRCTDVSDEYFGEWEIFNNDDVYRVNVIGNC